MRERIVNELPAATRARRRSLLADRHMGAVAARPDSTRRCAAMHDTRDEIVIGAVLRIRALRDTIACAQRRRPGAADMVAVCGPLLLTHLPDGMRLRCSMSTASVP